MENSFIGRHFPVESLIRGPITEVSYPKMSKLVKRGIETGFTLSSIIEILDLSPFAVYALACSCDYPNFKSIAAGFNFIFDRLSDEGKMDKRAVVKLLMGMFDRDLDFT